LNNPSNETKEPSKPNMGGGISSSDTKSNYPHHCNIEIPSDDNLNHFRKMGPGSQLGINIGKSSQIGNIGGKQVAKMPMEDWPSLGDSTKSQSSSSKLPNTQIGSSILYNTFNSGIFDAKNSGNNTIINLDSTNSTLTTPLGSNISSSDASSTSQDSDAVLKEKLLLETDFDAKQIALLMDKYKDVRDFKELVYLANCLFFDEL
jgi:hypothetical protein